jgi:glycosyltransferase involved in cell wall biosynthesis
MDLGSCREVVEDGQTGFLVSTPEHAVQALGRLAEIDRRACRHRVEQHFSIATMIAGYEHVYATIFELEENKR